jgi:hypothetical protein
MGMKHKGSKKKSLTRTDFIKTTSVGIGAAAVVGLNAEPPISREAVTTRK